MTQPTPDRPWVDAVFADAMQLYSDGNLSAASSLFRMILRRVPGHTGSANNLGIVLRELGFLEESLEVLRHAIGTPSQYRSRIYNNIGITLRQLCRPDEAVAAYQQALNLASDDAEVLHNMAVALQETGDLLHAEAKFRLALHYQPRAVESMNSLSLLLKRQDRFAEAERLLRDALRLAPGHVHGRNNLAGLLLAQGQIDPSVEEYQQASLLAPGDATIHSNLIMAKHYSDQFTAADLAAESRAWHARHAQPLQDEFRPHPNTPEPERRLRIGYLSADLRQHPVGFFFGPVLRQHDRSRFEVFIYAGVQQPDAITTEVQTCCDHWIDTRPLQDLHLVERIRRDEIDILVDLSGHTSRNRLLVCARRPAPVQLVAGGHFCTTGMDASVLDGLVVDRFHVPPALEALYSEPVLRMPDGYVCYEAPAYAPAVVDPPCLRQGYVTFGCFNKISKLTTQIMAVWADLLHAVPDSRLMLNDRPLREPAVANRFWQLFAAVGIPRERILLAPGGSHAEFLASYGQIDVALDSFPYSGGLTTCEALWMGVPVVTMTNDRFSGRHSCSHLNQAGLEELVADCPESYIQTAIRLSADQESLVALRHTLRERLRRSPLGDTARYTIAWENQLHQLWQQWCRQQQDGAAT